MLKRFFDIIFSFIGLIISSPFLIIIAVLIVFDSKGGIFFKQIRVGKNNIDFSLYKFRTMQKNSDVKGLITIGNKDSRITKVGLFLRKYKLDELPQFFNVFIGNMSIVGPRPEVRKYVEMYEEEQMKVLSVKPGLTDYASIEYINESEILGKVDEPEKVYYEEIIPAKLKLNLIYIKEQNFITDLKIILRTFVKILNL